VVACSRNTPLPPPLLTRKPAAPCRGLSSSVDAE